MLTTTRSVVRRQTARMPVLAAALLFVLTSCGGTTTDTVIASSDGRGAAAEGQGKALRAGAITSGQAGREGLDAREHCTSAAVRAFLTTELRNGSPTYQGGYSTDPPGLAAWGSEYAGDGRPAAAPGSAPAKPSNALCWYHGPFEVIDYTGAAGATVQVRYVILDVNLSDGQPFVTATSDWALPLLAPQLPDVGESAGARRTAHAQPRGVRVVPGDAAPAESRGGEDSRLKPTVIPSPR